MLNVFQHGFFHFFEKFLLQKKEYTP